MQMFIHGDNDLISSIQSFISNTFFTTMFPSAHGFSTYNRYAFISSQDKDMRNADIRYRSAIYIIIIHEYAHLLRRINFKTYRDAKNAYSPLNSQEDEGKIYNENFQVRENFIKNQGESGFKAEMCLFGSEVINITRPAADYLITFEPGVSLEEFRTEFIHRQTLEPRSRIDISRSSHIVRLSRRCGYSRYLV